MGPEDLKSGQQRTKIQYIRQFEERVCLITGSARGSGHRPWLAHRIDRHGASAGWSRQRLERGKFYHIGLNVGGRVIRTSLAILEIQS